RLFIGHVRRYFVGEVVIDEHVLREGPVDRPCTVEADLSAQVIAACLAEVASTAWGLRLDSYSRADPRGVDSVSHRCDLACCLVPQRQRTLHDDVTDRARLVEVRVGATHSNGCDAD